jgi:hypothetical protein
MPRDRGWGHATLLPHFLNAEKRRNIANFLFDRRKPNQLVKTLEQRA